MYFLINISWVMVQFELPIIIYNFTRIHYSEDHWTLPTILEENNYMVEYHQKAYYVLFLMTSYAYIVCPLPSYAFMWWRIHLLYYPYYFPNYLLKIYVWSIILLVILRFLEKKTFHINIIWYRWTYVPNFRQSDIYILLKIESH